MPPDEPNEEEKEERLPQDGPTPFRPAPSTKSNPQDDIPPLDDTHPTTDTNIQPEELYDEGVSGAAEAEDPTAGNDVTNYDKPETKNKRETTE